MLEKLIRDDSAASMSEYAMILALIAVAALVALAAFGDGVEGVFGFVGGAMDDAGVASGS
jgi:Flp pilus assembly pilin Flp